MFVENVDFWRDIFPGGLGAALPEMAAGQRYSERFAAGTLVPEYSQNQVVSFRRSAIAGTAAASDALEPGRFYPRGYFWKPLGAFAADRTPVKLVDGDASSLTVDANHPLARFDLEIEATVHRTLSISAQRGGSLHDIAELITEKGPGMQDSMDRARYALTDGPQIAREDETDDGLFYRAPRLVHHLDDTARHHVQSLYGRLLKPRSRVLDLMCSWESHLPDALRSCRVDGVGLNEQELQANDRLADYLVHDLNREPALPYDDGAFDGVICTVSIEYLCRPLEVMAELSRILKPGGVFAAVISERWFEGKQILPWANLHPFERQGGVMGYLLDDGGFAQIRTESIRGYPRPDRDRHRIRTDRSDSLYSVWALRS